MVAFSTDKRVAGLWGSVEVLWKVGVGVQGVVLKGLDIWGVGTSG